MLQLRGLFNGFDICQSLLNGDLDLRCWKKMALSLKTSFQWFARVKKEEEEKQVVLSYVQTLSD